LFELLLLAQLSTSPGDLEIGIGVICDTSEQVHQIIERVVDKGEDNATAFSTVNQEAGTPHACVVQPVAYEKNEVVDRFVSKKSEVFEITKITVRKALISGQWATIDPPTVQYTVFGVEEKAI